MCRSALCSLFALAFRSRECHSIRPCTVVRLPLTEACLRFSRTSLFMPAFPQTGLSGPERPGVGADAA